MSNLSSLAICVYSFEHLKKGLNLASIIESPDWNQSFELMCDTSDYAVGSVLDQRINKIPHVIYYASKTLNDAQLHYCYHGKRAP